MSLLFIVFAYVTLTHYSILFAISVLLLPALFAKHKRAQKTATKAGAGWGA